jgi:antitoxin component of MazEF toxin-antitoxin module
MTSEQVMTLDNPVGLLLPLEMLQRIGISTGDQIEISVSERALTVRPLTEAETERKKAGTLVGTKVTVDEGTAKADMKTVDEMMESIMDRHDNLFRRLAEGVK